MDKEEICSGFLVKQATVHCRSTQTTAAQHLPSDQSHQRPRTHRLGLLVNAEEGPCAGPADAAVDGALLPREALGQALASRVGRAHARKEDKVRGHELEERRSRRRRI